MGGGGGGSGRWEGERRGGGPVDAGAMKYPAFRSGKAMTGDKEGGRAETGGSCC